MTEAAYQTVEVDLVENESPDEALNSWAAQGYAVHSLLPSAEGRVRYLLEHRSVRAAGGSSLRQQPAKQAPRSR